MADTVDIFGNVNAMAPWYEAYDQLVQLPLWQNEADIPGFSAAIGQRAPSIAFFPAKDAKERGCVLVIAGGSYVGKAPHEGPETARYLNKLGYNAAVLDYRVVPYAKNDILADGKRAVRYLYANAETLGFNREKIGVMGFSAGGNLAAMLCFAGDDGDPGAADPIDRCPCRPAGAVLGYAAVNLVEEYDDDDEFNIVAYFDHKLEPGYQFPPAFIWQTFGDKTINYQVSFGLADALRRNKTPVSLHVFPDGEHGKGLAHYDKNNPDTHDNFLPQDWTALCDRWLQYNGF